MAFLLKDRVKQSTTTTGTGPFALSAAFAGYQRFSDVASVGDTFWGAIVQQDGDWVTGLFTYSAANQITVTTVFESSNAGSAVTFGAGVKSILVDLPASRVFPFIVPGATSGNATIVAQAAAGTPTLTLPTASGTFAVSASGPIALNSGTGALSLNANGITYAFFQQVAASSLVGNPTGSLANAQGITLGATLAFSGSAMQTTAGTGDVTWSANSFATTIAANVISNAKFRQSAARAVVGNGTNATANVADIAGSASQFLGVNSAGTALAFQTLAGDATLSGPTLTIAAAAVSYAKIQNVAASRLLGNPTGSPAAPAEITLGATLAFSGSALQTTALTGDVTASANSFVTALSRTFSPTMTGNWTFSPTAGDALTINSVAASNSRGYNITMSGPSTATPQSGPIALNLVTVSSYNAGNNAGSEFADGGAWNTLVAASRVNFSLGGANLTNEAPYIAFIGHTRLTTASANIAAGADFEGVTGVVYSNVLAPNANMEGIVGAGIADGSTINTLVGGFFEVDLINNPTVGSRRGVNIANQGTGTATGIDTAILVGSSNVLGSFKTFVTFNTAGGTVAPLQTTANLFQSDAAMTIAGVISGANWTVTGNVITLPKIIMQGSNGWTNIGNAIAPDSPITINSNTAASVAVSAGTNLHIVGADATNNIFTFDGYGGIPIFAARRADGTQASKTVVVANDQIFNINMNGWDGSVYGSAGSIQMKAGETFSGTAHGSFITAVTVPFTTTTVAEAWRTQGSGGFSIGATTDPAIGGLLFNGQAYGPNIATTASGANAFIDTGTTPVGQLKRSTSSLIYKRDVEPLDAAIALKVLGAAKPIWYRSAIAADNPAWSWYGFGAEDMAAVDPRLVHYGYQDADFDEGEIFTDPVDGVISRAAKKLKPGATLKPDGVQYERLTPHLVTGWRQHDARIAALEARVH